eukprot:6211931-Alexandrium_andersonii.AAC.1
MGMSVVLIDAVKSCSDFEDGMKRLAEHIGMKAKQNELESTASRPSRRTSATSSSGGSAATSGRPRPS